MTDTPNPMEDPSDIRIGDLLVEYKVITPLQLSRALIEQHQTGGRLGQILIKHQYATEEQIVHALSQMVFRRNLAAADNALVSANQSSSASRKKLNWIVSLGAFVLVLGVGLIGYFSLYDTSDDLLIVEASDAEQPSSTEIVPLAAKSTIQGNTNKDEGVKTNLLEQPESNLKHPNSQLSNESQATELAESQELSNTATQQPEELEDLSGSDSFEGLQNTFTEDIDTLTDDFNEMQSVPSNTLLSENASEDSSLDPYQEEPTESIAREDEVDSALAKDQQNTLALLMSGDDTSGDFTLSDSEESVTYVQEDKINEVDSVKANSELSMLNSAPSNALVGLRWNQSRRDMRIVFEAPISIKNSIKRVYLSDRLVRFTFDDFSVAPDIIWPEVGGNWLTGQSVEQHVDGFTWEIELGQPGTAKYHELLPSSIGGNYRFVIVVRHD